MELLDKLLKKYADRIETTEKRLNDMERILLETQKQVGKIVEKLNDNYAVIQSLLETGKIIDKIVERLNSNDITTQSLLKTQILTDKIVERLNDNDLTMQSLLKTQKLTDKIVERLNKNDVTTQSLLETQKLTDGIVERLNKNDVTTQSLLETQKLTDKIFERLNENDVTMQSLLETQKIIYQINGRLNANDATIQSLLKTQMLTDKIVERLDINDLTNKSLIETQKRFDVLEDDYRKNKLKFISRTERLAEILIDIEKDNIIIDDFWNEGEFIMLDKRSYSQAGEDSIVAHITASLGIPFDKCNYLDLGANQPKEMSNTYFFYSHGASGVLVEANPHLAERLRAIRSRDTVLNNCVGNSSGKIMKFNILNIDGLSAFGDVSDILEKNPNTKIEEIIDIESISVSEIIEKYYAKEPPVIFNIDIEGMEMTVLSEINFEQFRPLIIIVEMIPYFNSLVVNNKNSEIYKFLTDKEYIEYAFTGINSIFIDKKAKYLKEDKIANG